MTRYLIILEETPTGFSAYAPDIPGCVATGRTRDEAEREMHDAIALHLEGLHAAGLDAPKPVAKDWAWLDALTGPLDEDFVRAVNEQPGPQEHPSVHMT